MQVHDAALLLLGHGSTLNADSSAPTYQHAEEIRQRGLFAEVHVAFWKEEANFRQALRQIGCHKIYVVPNFISSGYFTEQIIPRELGLGDAPITRLAHQTVYYCQPVGLHSSMTEALLQRARQVVADSKETIAQPAKTACLFICGHGTSFNDNSTKIIHEQAALIRAQGIYADCQPVLMEQTPFVKDWRTLTSCPDVIVVPFFIADGLHSFEDIPVLLGLTPDVRKQGFTNPTREKGRRLWYATAIGTEPFVADVILAQVAEFQERHLKTDLETTPADAIGGGSLEEELSLFFEKTPPPWKMGQVMIRPGFELFHQDDRVRDPGALRRLESIADLRELVRLDGQGRFRPLRAAPSLRTGWIYHAADLSALRQALDYLYPAELANWALEKRGTLSSTPWAKTAERQTGRFRVVRELDLLGVAGLVAHYCEPGCLKQRLWSPAKETRIAEAGEMPLWCPEACNFLIGKAREKLKGGAEE